MGLALDLMKAIIHFILGGSMEVGDTQRGGLRIQDLFMNMLCKYMVPWTRIKSCKFTLYTMMSV